MSYCLRNAVLVLVQARGHSCTTRTVVSLLAPEMLYSCSILPRRFVTTESTAARQAIHGCRAGISK